MSEVQMALVFALKGRGIGYEKGYYWNHHGGRRFLGFVFGIGGIQKGIFLRYTIGESRKDLGSDRERRAPNIWMI
jgi:hypothetical protein